MEISEFKKHYQESSIKFIWEYSAIKEYVPIIERAISDTVDFLQSISDEEIDENDIREVIINDKKGEPSKIIFYLKNRKINSLGTIFSNFREHFTTLTKGYDDKLGLSMPPRDFEQAETFFKSIGYSDEQMKLKWDEIQS
ncbi:MAG: hypothetical protein KAT04_10985 [Methylococcales bacterium]|nr:hypothetical protein [Methylococcales bacterium]